MSRVRPVRETTGGGTIGAVLNYPRHR